MLVHGYTPTDLLKSSVISIPKDAKVSLSNIDNYRGIALFNCICKLYDNITLFLHGNYLNTSDMQFGYKKGHSTTMCTLIYKEIINQYINNGSDVYSCLLDASKAFDRVHYGKLFRILLSKKLPILIIRWILDSYLRQSVCVMWDSCKSEYFKMYNGVKQGGFISCHLFNLYIDPLLVQLSNSDYGCHMRVYAGALSYADDITLLCPSVWGLNEMLKICNKYRLENNIIFNSKKTVCIKFGSTIIEGESAFFDGVKLEWTDKVRHLGNFIDTTCTDYIDCIVKKSHFIGYVNKLKVHFGKTTHNVLINLFKSYCCSFYSSHLWKFNSHGFDKICKSWNIAIRTLLQLPFNAHTWLLGPITEQNNIRTQLYIRNYRFLYYASRSSNVIVKQCINHAMYNSNSDLGYKFAFYRYTYNIDIFCTMKHAVSKITRNELTYDQLSLVKNLKTLLDFRSGYINIDGFTIHDVNNLIYTLSID